MPEYKNIPAPFSKYKVDLHGVVVRKSDDYKPYVALDFKTNLYDDSGVQQEVDVHKFIKELFPAESRNISYGAAFLLERPRFTANRPSTGPSMADRMATETRRTPDTQRSGRINRAASPAETTSLPPDGATFNGFNRVMGLRIFKHFKAYILRRKGYSRQAISRTIFNNNGGAARNAEILYTNRPAIVLETARMLRRRMGANDYNDLRRILGVGDDDTFILPTLP